MDRIRILDWMMVDGTYKDCEVLQTQSGGCPQEAPFAQLNGRKKGTVEKRKKLCCV